MDRRNGSLGSYLRKSPLNILRQRMSSIVPSFLLNADREPPFSSYDAGINTFDTANVCYHIPFALGVNEGVLQVYSNGLSEITLGKAIKQLNLPRDEIVVMTKV